MEAEFVIRNGELMEKDKACISIYNKSFFFDFAVYSNIKVIQGRMSYPELEIGALLDSANSIGISHNLASDKILEWAKILIKENNLNDALIRLLLIGAEEGNDALLFLFPVGLTFYPDKFYTKGVKLVTYSGERFLPVSKTKSLLMSYLAYRKAEENNAIDALLIDRDRNIREGTRCSFYAINGNTLIAPPKEKVLTGVTRKIILRIAQKIMDIKEVDIPLDRIKDYDECFISGTSIKIMPVRQVDSLILREEAGGKVKALQKLFKEF